MPANTQLGAADLIGRELPYSIEAEQTVIGALLLSPDSISTALKYLKPESFYHTQHREIFSIILRMFSNGVPADVITVINESVAAGVFETSAMAKAYLTGIMENVPSVANLDSYCRGERKGEGSFGPRRTKDL